MLARSVPEDMVYRPKMGFSPPFREMLRDKEIQDAFRQALFRVDAPLDPFYKREVLRFVLDRGGTGGGLSRSPLNLLWTLFFATSWLDQVRDALDR
jgi:hypothetical protein